MQNGMYRINDQNIKSSNPEEIPQEAQNERLDPMHILDDQNLPPGFRSFDK